MNETHEKGAQLLAVECVLLLCNVNFNMSGGDVIQQHSYQLDQESKIQGGGIILKKTQFLHQKDSPRLSSLPPTWQRFPQAGISVPRH